MRYGTSYFKSRAAAVKYYRAYEGSDAKAAVARKLREGEIHIGKPPLKAGDRIRLIDGGTRYEVEEQNPSKRSVRKRMSAALKKYIRGQQNPRVKGRKVKGGRSVTLKNFTGTIVKKSDGTVDILGRGRR